MARSQTPTGADPFDDCELGPDAILGTHTYSGRVYSPEKASRVMNVDVRTGDPTHDIPTPDAVDAWTAEKNADARDGATDRVALVAGSGEQLHESGCLVSLAAFYYRDITSYDLHFAYNRAVRSDDYTVDYDVDYGQGTATITVTER